MFIVDQNKNQPAFQKPPVGGIMLAHHAERCVRRPEIGGENTLRAGSTGIECTVERFAGCLPCRAKNGRVLWSGEERLQPVARLESSVRREFDCSRTAHGVACGLASPSSSRARVGAFSGAY